MDKGLPFKGGERTVSTHEADRDQEPQRGIHLGAPLDASQKEPDDQASRKVDHECAVRESSPHPVGYGRADKIAGHRAQRSPDRDKKIFLQIHLHKGNCPRAEFLNRNEVAGHDSATASRQESSSVEPMRLEQRLQAISTKSLRVNSFT